MPESRISILSETPGRTDLGAPSIIGVGRIVPRLRVTVEARSFDETYSAVFDRIRVDVLDHDEFIGTADIAHHPTATAAGTPLTFEVPVTHLALRFITDRATGHKVNLCLRFSGAALVAFPPPTASNQRPQGQIQPSWQNLSFGVDEPIELVAPISRSDWFKEILEPIGFDDFVLAEISIPRAAGRTDWESALAHLGKAEELYTKGDDPEVLARCYSALRALPGAPTETVSGVPNRSKREAVDKLIQKLSAYYHLGRHPDRLSDVPGSYPADRKDASFALNMTKVMLAYLSELPAPVSDAGEPPEGSS